MNLDSIPRPEKSCYKRYRTPTVIQMEAAECGAAALRIILGYYGSFVPLEEVRLMCSVSRDGSNAFKILQAAEYYGLNAEGFSADLKDLYQAPLPLIAFWNFDHFIVIEGFKKNVVFINDPESGPRTISYEELNHSFTGIILTFSPSEKFKQVPMEEEKKWLPLLWNRFKFFKGPLIFSVLTSLLIVIPLLSLTVLSQLFIDYILIENIQSWSTGLLISLAFSILLLTVMTFLQQWIFVRFSLKLTTLLSSQFVWHTLRLPILFFLQRFGGEIASRFALNEQVAHAWVSELLPTLINMVIAAMFACVMFFYDVTITFIAIGVVFIHLLLMRRLYRSREDAYANYRQIQGRLSSFTLNGLESIESVKAVGGEYQFVSQYGGVYAKSLDTLQKMSYTDLILGTVSPFFSTVGSMAVLILGALRIIRGEMTVGEFVALQMLFNQFSTPAMTLVNLNQTMQLLRINLLRIDDVMRHQEDPLLDNRAILQGELANIPALKGEIEVKNLSFAYGPLDSPLLKKIHLKINPGTTVALVGPSGSGKSTLIKLIGGLLTPKNGDILFDQVSYLDYPREALTQSIGVVEQTSYLFEDSVEQNITLMNPNSSTQDMIDAARDACIHDEIMKRPGGYQSLVEREGGNFSGGQRQRLEIAAVLCRKPAILILDEATSALDAITERRIFENIRKRAVTSLIITHRLKTIVDCDCILVMDQGEIVEKGRHEDLIKKPGIYQSLVNRAESIETIGGDL